MRSSWMLTLTFLSLLFFPSHGYDSYSLNHSQVYYTTPTFSIKPNTTTVIHGDSAPSGFIGAPTITNLTSSNYTTEEIFPTAKSKGETTGTGKSSSDGALSLQNTSNGPVLILSLAFVTLIVITLV
jgi:hypothetical protein